jgi:hypothetical protein
MRRYLNVLLMGAMLTVPIATVANAQRHNAQRYYDSGRRDYHEWNDNEDRAYRHWLQERHKKYRDWKHASKADQRAYWRWRHDHPQNDWRM